MKKDYFENKSVAIIQLIKHNIFVSSPNIF